jgi:hypothetical protein
MEMRSLNNTPPIAYRRIGGFITSGRQRNNSTIIIIVTLDRPDPKSEERPMVLILRFPRPAMSLVLAGLVLVLGSVLGAPARAQSGEPILRIETGAHAAPINAMSVDAAGRLLLTASEDKTARLWSLPDGHLLTVLRPPQGFGTEGKLFAAALSPDGAVAAVGGDTGQYYQPHQDQRGHLFCVYLFETATGRMLRLLSINQKTGGAEHLAGPTCAIVGVSE